MMKSDDTWIEVNHFENSKEDIPDVPRNAVNLLIDHAPGDHRKQILQHPDFQTAPA